MLPLLGFRLLTFKAYAWYNLRENATLYFIIKYIPNEHNGG